MTVLLAPFSNTLTICIWQRSVVRLTGAPQTVSLPQSVVCGVVCLRFFKCNNFSKSVQFNPFDDNLFPSIAIH